jgi:GT2 family glycosyltransferase
MKNSKLEVAIFNFNGLSDTRECLRSVLQSSYKNIVISVIDDGSIEDEMSILANDFNDPRVKFYRSTENLGFPARVNQVLRSSKSEFIFLLNND